jgi:hypothetical protein
LRTPKIADSSSRNAVSYSSACAKTLAASMALCHEETCNKLRGAKN